MDINKELSHKSFIQREYSIKHSPYQEEMDFYECVASGDVNKVIKNKKPFIGEGYGILSENQLRNLQYHMVITVALITRFCVERGMEMETAYNLSDLYIQQIDKCKNENDIELLHKNMVMDFTMRMKKIKKGEIYSKPIIFSIDYIYDNLHKKIKLNDIADYVSLSPQYLSKLFHQETGISLTEYITKKRIEAAQNMLKYSEYSSVDIGNYLSFSSHSHFIDTFKKYTGFTPREYKNKFYRTNIITKNKK